MKLKKILSLLLTTCLSVSLVACSQAKQVETTETVENKATEVQPTEAVENKATEVKFPEREITIVVPYDAGGASDMASRIVATGIEDALDATVLVENRSGGTGSVGMSYARAAKADGYTICYIPVELVMQKPLEISDLVPEDFAMIGQLTTVPAALTVSADSEFETVEDFIEYAKANPGKVNVGNSGNGSIWHLAATMLENETGTSFNHIPYDGAASAVTSLMGGHIDAVTVNAGEVLAGVEAGKLKVLALMTEERDQASFADIPTLKECGINVVMGGWGALAVPKDTPQEIVDILSNAVEEAAATQEFNDFISERGMIVTHKNAADAKVFVDEQNVLFADLLSKVEIN